MESWMDSRMHMTTGVVMSVIKTSVSVKLEEYITPRKLRRYTAAMPRPTAKASTTENSTSGMELVPMVWEENRLRMSLLFMGKPSSFVCRPARGTSTRKKRQYGGNERRPDKAALAQITDQTANETHIHENALLCQSGW